jgi:hypothetical protein
MANLSVPDHQCPRHSCVPAAVPRAKTRSEAQSSETVHRASQRQFLASCLFSQQIQKHARGDHSFRFCSFPFLSSSFRNCLEKRRGSSPFTPAVVYPESFISLAHSLAALRRMSAPKMPATEVTPLLRGGGGSEGGSGSSSLWSTDGEALSVTPVDAPDDESAGANKWRIAATFYGFFIVGATDGAYGVRRFRGLVVLIS